MTPVRCINEVGRYAESSVANQLSRDIEMVMVSHYMKFLGYYVSIAVWSVTPIVCDTLTVR